MKKVRVLHVANQMNLGGVERWLLGISEELKNSNIDIDILVHSSEAGVLDNKFKDLGVNLIPCLGYRNPIKYIINLFRILRKNEAYDVVHSHVLYFSGIVLCAAWLAKVPIRISHAHSNRSDIEPKTGRRALYIKLMKKLIKMFATRYFAVSQEAHKSVHIGEIDSSQLETLYCGIKHLETVQFKRELITELGINDNELVLGHVGRMSEPKNHRFLLQIFKSIKSNKPAKLVLVGDGELREEIEQYIDDLGLNEDVILLGARSDAVDIMASVFDIIVFPSLYEGLPLSVVEAQAVNVPILVADNITKEAEFDSDYVTYMSLKSSPKEWAEQALIVAEKFERSCKRETINVKFTQTDFYLPNHIRNLEHIYNNSRL